MMLNTFYILFVSHRFRAGETNLAFCHFFAILEKIKVRTDTSIFPYLFLNHWLERAVQPTPSPPFLYLYRLE